jgi:hypothetical protein
LKRASTRFWLCGSAGIFFLSLFLPAGSAEAAQTEHARARANELSLVKLRTGKSTITQAQKLYPQVYYVRRIGTSYLFDPCTKLTLIIDTGEPGTTISTLRVDATERSEARCENSPGWYWGTRKGLKIGDAKPKAYSLYGEPNSVSPSTKNGQPLELLYYAFDWAGPDAPQVMEVVCTAPKDGSNGRVVEITLAAGSL